MQMELLFVFLLEYLELLVKFFVPGVQDSSLKAQCRDSNGKIQIWKPQASGGTENHSLDEVDGISKKELEKVVDVKVKRESWMASCEKTERGR
jgi:hypothetical protein